MRQEEEAMEEEQEAGLRFMSGAACTAERWLLLEELEVKTTVEQELFTSKMREALRSLEMSRNITTPLWSSTTW